MDKEELERFVAEKAEGLKLEISTRRGCTHDAMDLKRVAAGKAQCVIWLEPEDDEVSVAARRACAIAALKALGSGSSKTARMIVQTSHDSSKSLYQLTDVPMAYRTPPLMQESKLDVMELCEEENFDRLLAQCALQPGLSVLFSEIFQHNAGKEFYVTPNAEFAGQVYSEARRRFDTGAVCGIYTPPLESPHSDGSVLLNPPEDTVMKKDDRLIVLSSDREHANSQKKSTPHASWVKDVTREYTPTWSHSIVVLCFGDEGRADSGIVQAISMFAPKGTNVTIVAWYVSRTVYTERVA